MNILLPKTLPRKYFYKYCPLILIALSQLTGCTYNRAMVQENNKSIHLKTSINKAKNHRVVLDGNRKHLQQQLNELLAKVSSSNRNIANLDKQIIMLGTQNGESDANIYKLKMAIRNLEAEKKAMEETNTSNSELKNKIKLQEQKRKELEKKISVLETQKKSRKSVLATKKKEKNSIKKLLDERKALIKKIKKKEQALTAEALL